MNDTIPKRRRGRPRVDDVPEGTIKVRGRDLAVLRAYAAGRKMTIKAVLNMICHALVAGGNIVPHPELAPDGWRRVY